MKKHTLVCMLKDDKNSSVKTLRLSSNPSMEKIREVYYHNLNTLKYVVKYCQDNSIFSLRVSSALFPLCSHHEYRDKLSSLLDEIGKEYKKIDFSNLELSSHPDQFILLSSVNPNVNEVSRYELEIYAHMSQYIPWNLVNIHVGSKQQGLDVHRHILKHEVSQLSLQARRLISLENDEKSYSFKETLFIAQENELMMVPDFHHERCFQKRLSNNGIGLTQEQHINWNRNIDESIYELIKEVIATYDHKDASPLFHISSPVNGWNGNFKEHCIHADYIDSEDYPNELENIMLKHNNKRDYRLDIEAKAKNEAIFKLENRSTK